MNTVAIVAGATGLVGGALVRVLLAGGAYGRVVGLARRDVPALGPGHEPRTVDYERLGEAALPFAGADVYCALGTTMAVAGSREAFRRVDFTYVVRLAALAAAEGARAFGLVSALGADPGSRIFYNRVKGEAERGVAHTGLVSVAVARPSLLRGDRAEVRRGERIADAVLGAAAPLLRGPLARLRPIEAETVARALARVVALARPGVRVYDPDALRRQAGVR